MQPGKGAHLVLNKVVLDAIWEALDDINEFYSDEAHDASPEEIQDSLLAGVCENGDNLQRKWFEERDSFGRKVFTDMPYKKGELRVTLVLTKQGELRLDIREWFEPV